MAIKLSVTVRNAKLDAIETAIGTAPLLKIRTGSAPATCATADSGTVLASITCPSDWASAASSGAKALLGTWSDTSADATGDAGHFRIYDSSGTTCHLQGTVTALSGGGDMELQQATAGLVSGQTFTVSALTLTEANS